MKFSFSIKKNINSIVILGRGLSSKKYFTDSTNSKSIQDVMLINYEEDDLDNKEVLSLNKNRIHILFNICEPHLSKEQIKRLTISSIHIARTKSMRFKGMGRRQTRAGNIYGKVKYLPNEVNKYWYLNNCGLLGIAYATKVLKAQNIVLYGFDFYQDKNFFLQRQNKDVKRNHPGENLIETGKGIKIRFLEFVKNNPTIDYFICSNTDIKPTSNLHLI